MHTQLDSHVHPDIVPCLEQFICGLGKLPQEKAAPQKIFLLNMITHFRCKAYMLATDKNLRRTPVQIRACREEAEEKIRNAGKKQLTKHFHAEHFPQRYCTSLNHVEEVLDEKNKNRVPCVQCVTLFEERMVEYSLAKWKPKKPDWHKEVTRTWMGCVGCSTDSHPCYLCKKHFDDFHKTP